MHKWPSIHFRWKEVTRTVLISLEENNSKRVRNWTWLFLPSLTPRCWNDYFWWMQIVAVASVFSPRPQMHALSQDYSPKSLFLKWPWLTFRLRGLRAQAFLIRVTDPQPRKATCSKMEEALSVPPPQLRNTFPSHLSPTHWPLSGVFWTPTNHKLLLLAWSSSFLS